MRELIVEKTERLCGIWQPPGLDSHSDRKGKVFLLFIVQGVDGIPGQHGQEYDDSYGGTFLHLTRLITHYDRGCRNLLTHVIQFRGKSYFWFQYECYNPAISAISFSRITVLVYGSLVYEYL